MLTNMRTAVGDPVAPSWIFPKKLLCGFQDA